MLIEAQSSSASAQNGGLLELLGGQGGPGGTAAGVIAATGDGSAELSVQPAAIDLVGLNYRVGNFSSTFPTGTGGIALHDTGSLPTSNISAGSILSSSSGALVATATGLTLAGFETSPLIGQVTAPASGNGAVLTIEAQPAASGGAGNNGGSLRLRSGPATGTGNDGVVQLFAGNGSNVLTMNGTNAATTVADFDFGPGSSNTPVRIQPTAPGGGGNGAAFTVKGMDGIGGSNVGGNLYLQPGIGNSSTQGSVIIDDLPNTPTHLLSLTSEQPGGAGTAYVPIIASESLFGFQSGLDWVPAPGQMSGNRNTQLNAEAKHLTECTIASPSQSFGSCPILLSMAVHGQVNIAWKAQCRVITAGSGTTVGDTLTETGFFDFVNTSSGTGAPSMVGGPGPYGVNVNAVSHFAALTWSIVGGTSGGQGIIDGFFQLSTSSGNLGTADCTFWTEEKYN